MDQYSRWLRQRTQSLLAHKQVAIEGGLAPVSLPLFQGVRLDAAGDGFSLSCMVILLGCENDQDGVKSSVCARRAVSAFRVTSAAPAAKWRGRV
jgi:hypothetical protein